MSVEFVDCVFSGKIQKAVFYGSIAEHQRVALGRAKNEFRGNDFRECELVDVDFRSGIDLTNQKLPTGSSYVYIPQASETLTRARGAVMRWTDLELRRNALAIIQTFEMTVSGGQAQLFVDVSSAPRSLRPAMRQLEKVLRAQGG
jgi:hypothetical protein